MTRWQVEVVKRNICAMKNFVREDKVDWLSEIRSQLLEVERNFFDAWSRLIFLDVWRRLILL